MCFNVPRLLSLGRAAPDHWSINLCGVFQIFDTELKDQEREVCFIDIAYDEIPVRYYKESEVSLCDVDVCECHDAIGEV